VVVGVVVPCFNEATRWNTNYWRDLIDTVPARFLFVDDGSVDGTGEIIKATTAGTDSACLHMATNQGKAEAVRRGLLEFLTDSEIHGVGYLDADGAFAIPDISRMQTLFEELVVVRSIDALWSSRVALAGRNIQRSDRRHYIGRIIATLVSLGYGEIPYDTQSGFKLFRASDSLRESIEQPFKTRWLFEIELLARWQFVTGRPMNIWEEPLDHWHDVPGSKIRGRELVRILRELNSVKREQRRFHPSQP
jgi:glycosyltransferase involved in cell wall biosynthesis